MCINITNMDMLTIFGGKNMYTMCISIMHNLTRTQLSSKSSTIFFWNRSRLKSSNLSAAPCKGLRWKCLFIYLFIYLFIHTCICTYVHAYIYDTFTVKLMRASVWDHRRIVENIRYLWYGHIGPYIHTVHTYIHVQNDTRKLGRTKQPRWTSPRRYLGPQSHAKSVGTIYMVCMYVCMYSMYSMYVC